MRSIRVGGTRLARAGAVAACLVSLGTALCVPLRAGAQDASVGAVHGAAGGAASVGTLRAIGVYLEHGRRASTVTAL